VREREREKRNKRRERERDYVRSRRKSQCQGLASTISLTIFSAGLSACKSLLQQKYKKLVTHAYDRHANTFVMVTHVRM
jgi:hypothetical protein